MVLQTSFYIKARAIYIMLKGDTMYSKVSVHISGYMRYLFRCCQRTGGRGTRLQVVFGDLLFKLFCQLVLLLLIIITLTHF